MDQAIRDAWATALESGEYAQGSDYLRTRGSDDKHAYCCLGVLACVLELDWNSPSWKKGLPTDPTELLSLEVLEKVGLTDTQQKALAGLNDRAVSFEAIALVIRSFT